MKRFSLALVLAAACSQHSTPAPQPTYNGNQVTPEDVVWTQLVNATANGTTIAKSGGQPALDDAGGVSAQSIGGGDGWLEVTVGDTQPYRFVGLARPHASTSGDAIDFAFRLQAGRADVYEMGAWQADNTVVSGDTLRVAVASGIVTYSKNGNAIFTSTVAPQYPLAATASLIDAGAAVNGARVGIDVPTTTGNDTFVTAVLAQPTAAGTGATISWTTNVPTDGQVQYGTTTSYGTWSTYASAMSTTHSIAIDGLAPGTAYHYRVRAEDAGKNAVYSADATFTTPTPGTTTPPPSANKHAFCGWLLATGNVPIEQDPGYLAFAAHASDFDAVHPMWYSLASTTTFNTIFGVDAASVLSNTTVGGKRTLLIPTIAGADGNQPQLASTMIHDATLRAQHEDAIVNLVMTKKYDGIDLDYEHLPDSDKAAFSVFAQELAAKLHAKGKTLSFAVGGLVNAKYTYWDYDALSAVCDQLHVMGYDFHYLGSHPGPVAPLGWIQQVLAYIDTVGGGGRANKFILGLPNYGLAGSDTGTTTWFGSGMDSINLLGGTYATTTTHMATCPMTNGETIIPGRAPNGTTAQGHLFFDDLASMEEKVSAAKTAGLAGITYWTIGGEPDRPGPKTFWQMIRSYFPQ